MCTNVVTAAIMFRTIIIVFLVTLIVIIQAKKSDKKKSVTTTPSEATTFARTVAQDDVTIKNKIPGAKKEWPVREMIAILGWQF